MEGKFLLLRDCVFSIYYTGVSVTTIHCHDFNLETGSLKSSVEGTLLSVFTFLHQYKTLINMYWNFSTPTFQVPLFGPKLYSPRSRPRKKD